MHAGGYLQTAHPADAFYTTEPQEALHARIGQLNGLHNDCLRAMRYPMMAAAKGVADGASAVPPPTDAELIEEFLGGDGDDAMDM